MYKYIYYMSRLAKAVGQAIIMAAFRYLPTE